MLKTMPIHHLMAWCEKQNLGFDVFNSMLDKANSDIEYWYNKDYWNLYDSIFNLGAK